MRLRRIEDVQAYDTLLISPHVEDAPLACAVRLGAEHARGARVLLVVVCGDPSAAVPGSGWPAWCERQRLDLLALGLPPAAERDPGYASFRAATFETRAGDTPAAAALHEKLNDLRQRVQARDVFLPLGVGGHADHRLVLEAALGVFEPGESRNVFFYEERPAALLPGAVRMRLCQLGARLPPEVRGLSHAGLARTLLRFQREPYFACSPSAWAERVRCSGLLARLWREARAWRPQRGLGLRLQPLIVPADPQALAGVQNVTQAWCALRGDGGLGPRRLQELASGYSSQLGTEGYLERYWLMLPSRDDLLSRPLFTPPAGQAIA